MAKTTIKQHDSSDCGAVCLASVAVHYKFEIPISRIRQYAGTEKKGTTVYGLIEAAQKIGFDAKGLRANFENLFKLPKPTIAHTIVKGQVNHYVVIYKIAKNHILVMDPALGKMEKYSHADFKKDWTGVLVVLLPNENFKRGNAKISSFQHLVLISKPHTAFLIQAFIGALLYTLLGFSTSIYVQKITDLVLVDGNTDLLNMFSAIMLALLIFQVVVGMYKDVFLIRIGQRIDSRLVLGYYKHLLKLPQQFFDNMLVGEVISRINDATEVRTFINRVSFNLAMNILIVVFSFGLMFSFDLKLALIILTMIPVYLLIYGIIDQLGKKDEKRAMESVADFENQLVESLSSVSTIKMLGLESFASIKTETHFNKLLKSEYWSAVNSAFSNISSNALAQFFIIILLWVGSSFVISKQITLGELLFCYTLMAYFVKPLSNLASANKQVQNVMFAIDRLFGVMELECEDWKGKVKLTEDKITDIHFIDTTFNYKGNNIGLKNLNLTISKGKITTILGDSGSGKTTLISLIQKIYPVTNGKINIGDINIKHIENDSFRKFVAVVPQKISLFTGSIIENIAIGQKQPDLDRVYRICKDIGLLEFIESLPNDFQTHLNENNATLSGGQKQCIAIARAIYRNPEVLILDEATSFLASETKYFVQKVIDNMRSEGKTIVITTQQPSSAIDADKIVILNKGEIIEEGCHKELFDKKGAYFKLWQQQMPPSPDD